MNYSPPALIVIILIALWTTTPALAVDDGNSLPVDTVWAGHSVGFSLLTQAPYQYVAYYNQDRELVVASRRLEEASWVRVTLPEKVGWDSHNYLTMAMDDSGHLHLSGNMHVNPLVYFKTTAPYDIQTLTREKQLVGTEESRMTYPRFFRGPAGEFIFTYRDGSSGSGNQIYNVYEQSDGSWSRLLDGPLTDGRGLMNAYLDGPRLGPDGRYHVVWVWRDTPDCASNHHLSYMRSGDLRHWEDIDGKAINLPASIDTPGIVVDPVPPGGGLINGNARLGFDTAQRPIVSYHKYDEAGNSQVYNARWEDGQWKINQATQWDTRWSFQGGGTIQFDVRVGSVDTDGAGGLVQSWSHWERGSERWQLDPATLKAVEKVVAPPAKRPPGFGTLNSSFEGMQVRSASDSGKSPYPNTNYILRWETLGPNRDKPRSPPFPEPSTLSVYTISD